MVLTLAARSVASQGRDRLGEVCLFYLRWLDRQRAGMWKAMIRPTDVPVAYSEIKGISVRTLERGDGLRSLTSLHNRAYVGAGDYRKAGWIERRSLQSSRGSDPSLIWLAYEGDKAVGYCMVRCRNRNGRITGLAVLPVYRRRNTGTHLMQRALYELSLRGAKEVHLEVPRMDRFSQDLYRKLGFE